MEQSFAALAAMPKEERYAQLATDLALLLDGETHVTAILANTAAALHDAFAYFWVGFYTVSDATWLTLGPFQGPVACTRIRHGRGVCGTAWANDATLVVPDVDAFPGHIACSSASRSEIVIPVHDLRRSHRPVAMVLDIDSTELGAFTDADRIGLERIVAVLEQALAACAN